MLSKIVEVNHQMCAPQNKHSPLLALSPSDAIDNTENSSSPEYQKNKSVLITEILGAEKTITNLQYNKWISVLSFFWVTGMLTFMCYTFVTYRKIKKKIQFGVRLYGRVYECDCIRSPFLMLATL